MSPSTSSPSTSMEYTFSSIISDGDSGNGNSNDNSNNWITLETPPFSEKEAFEMYHHHDHHHSQHNQKLVVAHYCISKIYEIISLSLDYERTQTRNSIKEDTNNNGKHTQQQQKSRTNKRDTRSRSSGGNGSRMDRGNGRGRQRKGGCSGIPSISDLFLGVVASDDDDDDDDENDNNVRLHLHDQEWSRPLLRILYNRSVDEYTKRGAALILSYIVRNGCARIDEITSINNNKQRKKQHQLNKEEEIDLLLFFQEDYEQEEHKTTTSPSRSSSSPRSRSSTRTKIITTTIIEETLESLISWLTSRLQSSSVSSSSSCLSSSPSSVGVITPTLGVLMSTTPKARILFNQSGGIGYLVRHIKETTTRATRNRNRKSQSSTTSRMNNNNTNNSLLLQRQRQQQSQQPSSSSSSSSSSSFLGRRNSTSESATTTSTTPNSPTNTALLRRRNSSLLVTNGCTNDTTNSNKTLSSSSSVAVAGVEVGEQIYDFLSTTAAAITTKTAAATTAVLLPSPTTCALIGGAGAAIFSSSSFRPTITKSSLLSTSTNTTMSNIQSVSATTSTSSYSNYSSSSSSQQQQLCYDLLFTMWCMSLDCTCRTNSNGINYDEDTTTASAIRRSFIRDGAIPALVYLLKTMISPREKVIRMTISCLKSLATSSTTEATPFNADDNILSSSSSKKNNNTDTKNTNTIFIREMIGCGILPILHSMMHNQLSCWNDIDLQQDIQLLYQLLTNYQSSHLTRWKTYLLELESGILRWNNSTTTTHTTTTTTNNCGSTCSIDLAHSNSATNFFRSNAICMEGTNYDFYPLQCLCNILYYRTSTSTTTTTSSSSSPSAVLVWDDDDMNNEELCESIAVCLYQIGEFILYYPGGNGRSIINHAIDNKGSSGGRNTKQLIMQYIYHPHLDIQQQALLCASKLLLRNNK